MDCRKKCKVCNFNLRQISCTTCMKCFCQECNRKWHFRPASSGDNLNFCFKGPSFGDSTTNDSSQGGGSPISDRSKHDLGLICEECERAKRTVYCIECDQGFCDECHSHIHRKGNRVLHKKTSLSRSEDYKILLNLVWIEGSATHSADLVNLERVLQVTGVTVQKAYTSVHVAGPVSHELSQLLNRLELQFATAPKMRGLSEAFIDFIVKKFDAAVFMNEIIIMSPEPLPEETRESLQRLYPSSRVKELRMSPPACSEEYHLQGEESKDLDKQQQSVGMAGSECSNQFGCRDSKDIDNDAVILHPETPTPNSSNTGTLQNSSSKGDAKFSRHPAGSRRVVPVPFTNLGERHRDNSSTSSRMSGKLRISFARTVLECTGVRAVGCWSLWMKNHCIIIDVLRISTTELVATLGASHPYRLLLFVKVFAFLPL